MSEGHTDSSSEPTEDAYDSIDGGKEMEDRMNEMEEPKRTPDDRGDVVPALVSASGLFLLVTIGGGQFMKGQYVPGTALTFLAFANLALVVTVAWAVVAPFAHLALVGFATYHAYTK